MTYLFLGNEPAAKDKKISAIKKGLFKNKNALEFDYELLYAHKLSAEDLKKTLVSLPTVASQRLVLIRQCHQLSKQNSELIEQFLLKPYSPTVLILDSSQWDEKSALVKKICQYVTLVHFAQKTSRNVFDLTKAIGARAQVDALKILFELFESGEHPLKLMGGLLWYWKKTKNHLSGSVFQKGLEDLRQADLNIKRSRVKSEYALEILVVRLCSLKAG